MITLHARLRGLGTDEGAALQSYADLYARVGHCLLADMRRDGRTGASFKQEYSQRFGITARQFNAVRAWVDGLVANRMANLRLQAEVLEEKRKAAEKNVAALTRRCAQSGDPVERRRLRFQLHQKKRRAGNLQARIAEVRREIDNPTGVCFGGRKLFHQQFDLEANGIDFAEWKHRWRAARNSEFSVMGSRDETAGCQGCVATAHADGTFSLRLRLPNGQYLPLEHVEFPYQAALLRTALEAHAESDKSKLTYREIPRDGKAPLRRKLYPDAVSPLFWRFLRDHKGWRVFVSLTPALVETTSRLALGAIGVDVNAGHLACAEVDRFGNPVDAWNEPCATYGKSTEQSSAIIEAAAISVVDRALATGKPIVLEKLDFAQKKLELKRSDSPRRARLLSSFAYRQVDAAICSRAAKHGVAVHHVNPAYTSLLGRVNYAKRYGLTVHQGAAIAIARRKMQLRETPHSQWIHDQRMIVAPTGHGAQVTFPLPERNRGKHVWAFLSAVNRSLQVELAAQRQERAPARCPSSQAGPFGVPAAPVATALPLAFAGAIPAREPWSTSFGPRHGNKTPCF